MEMTLVADSGATCGRSPESHDHNLMLMFHFLFQSL